MMSPTVIFDHDPKLAILSYFASCNFERIYQRSALIFLQDKKNLFINHPRQYKEIEIKWDGRFFRFCWWVHDGWWVQWRLLSFLTALYSYFCDFNVPASKEKFLVWKTDLCWFCLHAPSCSWLARSPILYMTYLMVFFEDPPQKFIPV